MPIKGLKGGIGTKALGYGLGAAEEETDAEFNQTVLLLHGDGTEGAGDTADLGSPSYKALEDASSNNHEILLGSVAATSAIGPYGNDFSPYYYDDGYWSVIFKEGAGNITIPDSSDFTFGSNNFSIGIWVFRTDDNASTEHGIAHTGGGSYTSWLLTTKKFWATTSGSSWNIQVNYSSDIALNQWVYLQINRVGNVYTAYHNGSSVGTTTVSGSLYDNSDSFQIGARGGTSEFNGYLSNLIVTNGGNLSGTSVPTAPTTTDSNTKLLCLQSNRFLDNSATGHVLSPTVTDANAPAISTNTPFTQSKTANVGSVFFDGDEDVVFVEEDSSEFTYGTGDYEFSCWVYRTVSGVQQTIFGRDTVGEHNSPYVYITSGNKFALYYTNSINYTAASSNVPLNAWCHLVASRVSGTLKFFQDGAEVGSASDGTNLVASTKVAIGGQHTGNSNMYTGYIADARVRKGTGVTSVTVPTTTVTAETGTELLTCQYSGAVRNIGFMDDSKYNHRIVRNGNAHMGTFSPFSLEEGYWSNYFDGSTSYILVPDSDEHNFGTGDFTIEMFVYIVDPERGDGHTIFLSAGNNTTTQFGNSDAKNLHGYFNNSDTIGKTDGVPDNAVILNQWNHIVVERSGTDLSILSNGTRHATVTFSGTVDFSNVQINRYHGTGYDMEGFISNLRFVKGSTVYNSDSYTVPTTPLTAIPNTTLLTCQSSRFIDNSTTGHTLTPYNGTFARPFSPFAPSRSYSKDAVGGSVYFDGTGDDLTIMKSNPTQMLTSNWTIEMWVYVTETGNIALLDHRGSNGDWGNQSTNGLNFQFYATSTTLYWQVSNTVYLSGSYYPTKNSWNHFAVTNDGTQTTIFLNGTQILNGTTNFATLSAGSAIDRFTIGRNPSGYDTEGYVGPVKIHLTEHYDADASTITVPTAPFTADANTFLLLNFDNAGIIDHTMRNNLETEGNVRISGQQTKFGTGSIYFDGTDDRIVLPYSEAQQLGTGQFTVELFVYFTATDQRQGFFGNDGGWYFQIYDGELEFALSTSAIIERAFSHSLNQWYHLAATRDSSNDVRLFIDGTQQGAVVNSTADLLHASNKFHIGNIGPGTTRPFKGGYMDEIRITKGVARYISDFTVPTKAFANR